MKWYVQENDYYIMNTAELEKLLNARKAEAITAGEYTAEEAPTFSEMLLNSDDISTWTESNIFYKVFYLLIDFESEALYNVQFQADGQTLTAYDGRHHVKIENPGELETYFYNIKGFSIDKLVKEYNNILS